MCKVLFMPSLCDVLQYSEIQAHESKEIEKRDKKEGKHLPYFLRLILKSDDFSKSVSCAFGACEGVILSPDTGGIEIVAAVVTLDNFIQLSVHLVYLPGQSLTARTRAPTPASTNDKSLCKPT